MNARELERKYIPLLRKVGGLLLLASADAVNLLDDSLNSEVKFLGVEAFRVFDNGSVQPTMEFSNIRFGKVEEIGGKLDVVEFKRGLQAPWLADPQVIQRTKALILEGTSKGYSWYEVSLEDPTTNELLFFR